VLTSDAQKIGGGELSDADAHVGRNGPERKWFYLIGLIAIFGCTYSQYSGVHYGLIPGILVVYGVPILVITLLWRTRILSRFFNRTLSALKIGLGYFGAFTVLGIFVGVVILIVLFLFDPNTVNLLDKPNPVLNIPSGLAWVMVAGSLLIVGPAEEYIFRGFVFGGLLELFKNRHWLGLAFVSSLLFGGVHVYYAITYGIASLILFTDLVTFGMAMAITYYLSGGNLFAPSLIHGVYDATAFVGVATTQGTGTLLRGLMVVIGLVAGLILLLERVRKKSSPSPDLIARCALFDRFSAFLTINRIAFVLRSTDKTWYLAWNELQCC
jgi:membrane protease YdiL (CAAX protease family)